MYTSIYGWMAIFYSKCIKNGRSITSFFHIKRKEENNMKIGIDLGGSHIGIGLVDKSYNIIDKMD